MAKKGKQPTYAQIIGANIRRVREQSGMTVAEFGAAMRLYFPGKWGKQTISTLETGGRPIEVAEVVIAALILDTDLPDLIAPTVDGKQLSDASRVRLRDTQDAPTVRAVEVRSVVAPPESARLEAMRQAVREVLERDLSATTEMKAGLSAKFIPGPKSKKER